MGGFEGMGRKGGRFRHSSVVSAPIISDLIQMTTRLTIKDG